MSTPSIPRNTHVGWIRAALAGLLSVCIGLAIGQLVASLRNKATSPVLAVGEAVIDRTPTPLKDWAIQHFGSNDKLVLLSSVTLGVLILAIVAGLLARRMLLLGAALLVVMLVVAGYAVLSRPYGSVGQLLPTVAAGVVGVIALVVLMALAGDATAAGLLQKVRALLPNASKNDGEGVRASRRSFIIGSTTTAVLAAIGAYSAQRINDAKSALGIKLPAARTPAPAIPVGLDTKVPGITPLRTPNGSFYRVDTELSTPTLDADSWELHIDGDVENPYKISYSDLIDMGLEEQNITITCVSNPVGGPYAGGATWRGVSTAKLLAKAKVRNPERPDLQVLSTSFDGFTISTPLGALTDNRGALLAVGMNGEPLPRAHGFPARLVTPGLYGMCGCTKWITRMTVTTFADKKAYWTQRGWGTAVKIKPTARIDVPGSLATVPAGKVTAGGIAWAQGEGVVKVQISLDNGPWTDAMMGPDVNVDYWRQWAYVIPNVKSGQHTLQARVIYGDNQQQSTTSAPVFPDGSSGIEQRVFLVS
ncbi:molybdopterin-dependent oxidoreductase [Rudaeicoccus suwonensis]|uniref:DMSO/TMAO reductase YedYZ molybdopterin-dependent catalytic subunit n=1 Tax=Rudaeicoccus suwonensis TaxID=657409 RepID=A0A561E153_9MICO|nr:molybdopterin-dependent oxidoreductase [Rudaeicoccus suwonensis]TWE09322.1 DMSO/TMAO reductase YedYZ molybdopterin-dependent catalytic subunit [Rudaeicoccus suwonensis]